MPAVKSLQGDALDTNCPTRLVLDQIAVKWTFLAPGALKRRFDVEEASPARESQAAPARSIINLS